MAFGLNDLINLSDVKDVWGNLEENNWQGLLNAVRKVRDEKGNNETLDKLEEAGRNASSQGTDFPDDLSDLTGLVRERL